MKRRLFSWIATMLFLCGVIGSLTVGAETATIDMAELFGSSPASAPKKIPVSNLVPGQNLLSGTESAYTFESDSVFDYLYNGQWGSASFVDFDIVSDPTGTGRGKMLAVTLDTVVFGEKQEDPANYIYYQVTVSFEKALNRPVHLVFDTHGKNQIGFWLGNSTYKRFGQPNGSWQKISIDNVSVFNGNMQGLYLQYATRPLDCSQTQYFDNIALYPYYQIRYNALYPDGSVGSDVKKFWFDASALTVASDGTVTGLPSRYPVEQTELSFAGYELLGWSTQRGAAEAVSEIALNGQDIELYPIWQKQKDRPKVELTVWLDGAKTVSTTEQLFVGDVYILPSYSALAPYTPDGKIPSFRSANAVYSPGSRILIPEGAEQMEIEAVYEAPAHPEYGELVFFENFETLMPGTYLYDPASGKVNEHPASYVNKNRTNAEGAFTFRLGDTANELFIADDGTGNHALAVKQRYASQRWPQVIVNRLDSISEDGLYTVCADFYTPVDCISHMRDYDMRIFYTASAFKGTTKGVSASDGGRWIHLSYSLPVTAGSAYEAITKLQLYVSTDGVSSDAVFYVDNVSLYVKKASARFEMNDTESKVQYFVPGDTIVLPRRDETVAYTPHGYTLVGYRMGDTLYAPGESYPTAADDRELVFTGVYEKKKYFLAFSPNGGYGTLPETEVTDGETVLLPTSGVRQDDAALVGWKAQGSEEILEPGSAYTFDPEAAGAYLDGTDRLFFTAVWDRELTRNTEFLMNYELTENLFVGASPSELAHLKLAYGTGLVPAAAVYHGEETVSAAELVGLADRLYHRSRRIAADYPTLDDCYDAMREKGICPEFGDLSAAATYADFAYVLANALPDDCYCEMVYDVTVNGLDKNDGAFYEARKLLRAGILPESTDFGASLSRSAMTEALAKTVQPALRQAENNRTLYILGDSLCAGVGGSSQGWVKKLKNYVGEHLNVVNYAIGGIDTRNYFSEDPQSTGKMFYENMMRDLRPGDYVMIALGTNDSTLWERGTMSYEASRENYARYAAEIRAAGGIPFLVCPVGRNTVDANGNYYESDPRIIECMNDVNTVNGAALPIINFKTLSLERFGAMSAAERAKIYNDSVHYTDYGAEVVCSYFAELITADTDSRLAGLRTHFTVRSLVADDESLLYPIAPPTALPETSLRTASPRGLRFKAKLPAAVRDITGDVCEYGFLVARKDWLQGNELTASDGVSVKIGVGYHNLSGTDILYAIEDEDEVVFSGVLAKIPDTKEAYQTEFAVRSYLRVGCSYFYGETVTDSLYSTAKRTETPDAYAEHILAVCEAEEAPESPEKAE